MTYESLGTSIPAAPVVANNAYVAPAPMCNLTPTSRILAGSVEAPDAVVGLALSQGFPRNIRPIAP